ncbi:metallophosphoesterase family protein [Natronomonas sp. LN261]|uniref:metallophosphoesterase family protein n=1 Tax=Natronomonas sp. LN261 TaxID=2750669 RepID=UPI0015EEB719|nr:metallophosphoesterase family protein [Natronomonas sp. LN261]
MPPELTLNTEIDAPHRRIDSTGWNDIYVVGDVHGCRQTLERLLERLDPTSDDLVVLVGDLVRKGPDSKGVIDLVRSRPNVRTVRGNNEQKLIDGRKSIDALTDEDLAYLESLPAVISWDDVAVVHGGIDHRKPVDEHTLSELLNTRSLAPEGGYERPFWFETRREGPRVFFGHTVLAEPFESEYAVGLDTGCVYGGQLTAYEYRTAESITVDPPETYLPRSSDSIVEPRLTAPEG